MRRTAEEAGKRREGGKKKKEEKIEKKDNKKKKELKTTKQRRAGAPMIGDRRTIYALTDLLPRLRDSLRPGELRGELFFDEARGLLRGLLRPEPPPKKERGLDTPLLERSDEVGECTRAFAGSLASTGMGSIVTPAMETQLNSKFEAN